MKCIYRRSQTDGQQIENMEDLFHVIHPLALSLPFLSFMLVFILPLLPSPPPHSYLSASISPRFAVSPPSCLSVLSAGYQVKVKCMPLSTLAFPWETEQIISPVRNGRKTAQTLFLLLTPVYLSFWQITVNFTVMSQFCTSQKSFFPFTHHSVE